VRDLAPYFQEQLQSLRSCPLVGDVRGVGMMAAVEMNIEAENSEELLQKDYAVGALVDHHCHEFGLLVRPLINICVLSPPLIITRDQVDELVEALRKGLNKALEDLREQGIWQGP
jgi:putrescine aminotransferase